MNHIVREAYLHIDFNGNEREASALQNELIRLCNGWLFPALDCVFDGFSPPDTVYSFDRLELDANVIRLDRLQNDLVAAVTGEIEKILHEHTRNFASARESSSSNVQHKTVSDNVEDAFLFFLETGRLPWFVALSPGATLETQLVKTWKKHPPGSGSLNRLRVILRQPAARTRLVRQFSETFLLKCLDYSDTHLHEAVQPLLSLVKNAGLPGQEIGEIMQHIWERIVFQIADGSSPELPQFMHDVWVSWPTNSSVRIELTAAIQQIRPDLPFLPEHDNLVESGGSEKHPIIEVIRQILRRSNVSDKSAKQFEHLILQALAEEAVNRTFTPLSLVQLVWQTVTDDFLRDELLPVFDTQWPGSALESDVIGRDRNPGGVSTSKSTHHPDNSISVGDGVYIENAGLVVLHPFLPQFFTALGIAQDEELLDTERALCLLHFLTTGQTTAPEYELILPKILCNVPIASPVAMNVQLTLDELDEAAALLEAVIRHWVALKNTGVDGLRGTFLMRSGKVVRQEDGDWHLTVENKAFDILMDRLPWGIGMIKLPWMERMLWVDWR